MVCLNENISFNIKSLKTNLSLKLKTIIDDYDHILNDNIILSLKNNIEKKIKELFNNDHFIYINMNNNICTFKHKRGSKDGFFCTRKINTNLINDEKDYLCCRHSKKHIPRKKENRKVISKNITLNAKNEHPDFKNIKKDLEKKVSSKNNLHENIHVYNISRIYNNKNKIWKKYGKRSYKKIFLGNSEFLDFSKIFKNILNLNL